MQQVITIDWKRFENLSNRGLLIVNALIRITDINKTRVQGEHLEVNSKIYVELRSLYAQLRSIVAFLGNAIGVLDKVKEEIKALEDRIKREARRNSSAANLTMEFWDVETEYIEDVNRKLNVERKELGTLRKNIHNLLIGNWRANRITHLYELSEQAIAYEPLKREFREFLRRITIVIEELYKIIKRDQEIEEDVLNHIQQAYNLLPRRRGSFTWSTPSTIRLIQELEKAYKEI